MRETIEQFMWAYQPYFRFHVEYETKLVLAELGIASTDVKVVLAGIATEENDRHAICVEPETGPLFAEHLAKVTRRGEELYQLDPESEIRYHPPGSGAAP